MTILHASYKVTGSQQDPQLSKILPCRSRILALNSMVFNLSPLGLLNWGGESGNRRRQTANIGAVFDGVEFNIPPPCFHAVPRERALLFGSNTVFFASGA